MNAKNEFLASAYLDGELTDEERGIAEADPAVMAEVERLRALRSAIADVPPASDAARERAIAAALGAFQEVHGATDSEPEVVPLRPRRDPMRWLGVAAAVLVIGLLGIVMATGLRGGDDDDSADIASDEAASEATDAAAAPRLTEQAESADEPAVAEADDGAASAGQGGDTADDDAETTFDADAMEDADAPADEPAEESAEPDVAAEEPASEPASTDDTMATALDAVDAQAHLDGLPIETEVQLSAVGRYLLDLVEQRELPPTPLHSCPFMNVLADAVLLDPADAGSDPDLVDVYIEVNTELDRVLAIDRDACTVVFATDLTP